ncbi:hypothetical protein HMPREF3226_02161 [Prevotella corporis]|uniref:Uncharacterized protein n=1 Tax=Prevotella corporis TaxID=28128 RepID=A0A133PXN1_9BACT|nr:hypothetical protein HMPREF3226_02161 [Prevotella corporis]
MRMPVLVESRSNNTPKKWDDEALFSFLYVFITHKGINFWQIRRVELPLLMQFYEKP